MCLFYNDKILLSDADTWAGERGGATKTEANATDDYGPIFP